MATNKKITQLDELTPATWADDDVIAIVDISAQETKKIQLSTFRGAVAGVSSLNASTPLTVDSATGDVTISVAINGGGTINAVFDEDNMASNSPTALATQQSIKAYVDSQVGTVDTLAEILANGNTSGGTNIVVSSGDVITTNTINETTAASGVTIDGVLVKDGQVDGRDVSVDGTKLDTVETSADVTDATNVLAALVGQEVVATGFTGTLDGVLGGGTPAAITGTALTLTTGATVTTVLDEDNMASNSATALATQQSIKAYVDSQVGTGDTLAEILANGNTTGGTDIVVSSGDVITTNTINETTAASGVTIDSLLVKDGGITGTTGVFSGNLTVDTNTLFVNAASNRVGIGTSSPATQLEVVGVIRSSGTSPTISVLDTNAGTDEKEWHIKSTNGPLDIQAINDAGGGGGGFLRLTRSANNVQTLQGYRAAALRYELSNWDNHLLFSAADSTVGTSSAHALIFDTNNIERMRITSVGSVGIGTASPSSLLNIYINSLSDREALVLNSNGGVLNGASIDIQRSNVSMGKIDADYFEGMRFYVTDGAGAAATERMRIDSSGNVGIGTASPVVPLHISSATPAIRLTDTDDNSDSQVGAAAGGLLVLDADISNEAAGTAILFRVDGGSEKMRIDSNGNVGIGRTSPTNKLEVDGAAALYAASTETRNFEVGYGRTGNGFSYVDLIGDATYTDYGLRILRNNTGPNTSSVIYHRGTGDFSIITQEAGVILLKTSNAERMRITNGGLVGIGTSSPAFPLDVQCDTAAFGLQLRGRSADNISVLRFRNNAADTTYFQLDIRATGSNLNTVANAPYVVLHQQHGTYAHYQRGSCPCWKNNRKRYHKRCGTSQ